MSVSGEKFGWLMRNVTKLKPLLNEIGFAAANELKQNFVVGGRPQKWEPSGRVKAFGGETLRDKGMLMNSMTHRIDSATSVLAGPGSSVSYKAAMLYYGGTIRPKHGKYLTFRVPARLVTHSKSGKELKNARKEYTFVRVRQVTIPPRDYLFLPPLFFDKVDRMIQEFIDNANGAQ